MTDVVTDAGDHEREHVRGPDQLADRAPRVDGRIAVPDVRGRVELEEDAERWGETELGEERVERLEDVRRMGEVVIRIARMVGRAEGEEEGP